MVAAAGISRGNLKYLVEKGMLEKSACGVYILPEVWNDNFFIYRADLKKEYSRMKQHGFFGDLTDRTPNVYAMIIPSTYNLTKPKENRVNCSQCKLEWHGIGVEEVKTPGGNSVKAYNRERTLCVYSKKWKANLTLLKIVE